MINRTIATFGGDTIVVCGTCAHYIDGYDPQDVGLSEWPKNVVEGRKLQAGLVDTEESTDSTLCIGCDVCGTERYPRQWFYIYAATKTINLEVVMPENTFATIDDVLNEIAERSFYESCDVEMNDDGSFTVTDAPSMLDDAVMWTYENGAELPSGAYDYSRVHESYETYVEATHIRYNLHNAVMALAEGHTIHFTYQVVDAYPTTPEDIEDDENGLYDSAIGWMLVAFKLS